MKYISESDAIEQYDQLLNDCYGEINICGYHYNAAYALKRLDSIAYGEGLNNWLDSENLTTDENEADEG